MLYQILRESITNLNVRDLQIITFLNEGVTGTVVLIVVAFGDTRIFTIGILKSPGILHIFCQNVLVATIRTIHRSQTGSTIRIDIHTSYPIHIHRKVEILIGGSKVQTVRKSGETITDNSTVFVCNLAVTIKVNILEVTRSSVTILILACRRLGVQGINFLLVLENAGYFPAIIRTYGITVLCDGMVIPIIAILRTTRTVVFVKNRITDLYRLIFQGRTINTHSYIPITEALIPCSTNLKTFVTDMSGIGIHRSKTGRRTDLTINKQIFRVTDKVVNRE